MTKWMIRMKSNEFHGWGFEGEAFGGIIEFVEVASVIHHNKTAWHSKWNSLSLEMKDVEEKYPD